ncbi:MAG: hypothetical protein ABSA05_07160 [Opitutaceae bacterium]|jgi:hypothetical protein
MDTVDLSKTQDFYTQNAKMAEAQGGNTAGTAAFDQLMQTFQNQNNTGGSMVDAEQDARRMQVDYKNMVKKAVDAMKSKDPSEQKHLFDNYLYDSRNYLKDHPDPSYQLWFYRAIAAINLNKPATGKQAAQILSNMPAQQRADPRFQRILAFLDKQGWMPPGSSAAAAPNQAPPAASK